MTFDFPFKGKKLSINAGKYICLINSEDTRELGVGEKQRVRIRNETNGKEIVALVDTSEDLVKSGEIGLFNDVSHSLNFKPKDKLLVTPISKPRSARYIKAKLDGQTLTQEQYMKIVKDIASNVLSDIEVTAFVVSNYMQDFSLEETISLTKAMVETGDKIEIGEKIVVDKHCIGGVAGNRTTMLVVPIVTASGYFMPKTSSRSITSAAGTADVMEYIANINLTSKQIVNITKKAGGVMTWGGAVHLAPADDKIINIEHPLSLDPRGQLIASVLAKKASVGAKFAVIDIPVGQSVKVKTEHEAEEMARQFIKTGKSLGIKIKALITDGSQPVGRFVGPALECKYILEILEGKRYDDLALKSVQIAAELFELVGHSPEEAFKMAEDNLKSGKALKQFKKIIAAQGGKKNIKSTDVKLSKHTYDVKSKFKGTISVIDNKKINTIARLAGAPNDKMAGVRMHVPKGQRVDIGDSLFTIYYEKKWKLQNALDYMEHNFPMTLARIILKEVEEQD